jgi:hypothetical protein
MPGLELGQAMSKVAYINERCRIVVGNTLERAVGMLVPNSKGGQSLYSKADLQYDLKSGRLVQSNSTTPATGISKNSSRRTSFVSPVERTKRVRKVVDYTESTSGIEDEDYNDDAANDSKAKICVVLKKARTSTTAMPAAMNANTLAPTRKLSSIQRSHSMAEAKKVLDSTKLLQRQNQKELTTQRKRLRDAQAAVTSLEKEKERLSDKCTVLEREVKTDGQQLLDLLRGLLLTPSNTFSLSNGGQVGKVVRDLCADQELQCLLEEALEMIAAAKCRKPMVDSYQNSLRKVVFRALLGAMREDMPCPFVGKKLAEFTAWRLGELRSSSLEAADLKDLPDAVCLSAPYGKGLVLSFVSLVTAGGVALRHSWQEPTESTCPFITALHPLLVRLKAARPAVAADVNVCLPTVAEFDQAFQQLRVFLEAELLKLCAVVHTVPELTTLAMPGAAELFAGHAVHEPHMKQVYDFLRSGTAQEARVSTSKGKRMAIHRILDGGRFRHEAEMDVSHHSAGSGHERSLVLTKKQKGFIAPEVIKQRVELQARHSELLSDVRGMC